MYQNGEREKKREERKTGTIYVKTERKPILVKVIVRVQMQLSINTSSDI